MNFIFPHLQPIRKTFEEDNQWQQKIMTNGNHYHALKLSRLLSEKNRSASHLFTPGGGARDLMSNMERGCKNFIAILKIQR